MTIEEKIKQLNITLPQPPEKGGVYTSVKKIGEGLYYVSGCGTFIDGEGPVGKVGKELSLEEAQDAAGRAALNFLAAVKGTFGSLDCIKSIVKVLVLVASDSEFYNQPVVANGATQLLVDIFGEEIGSPSRSAIGVNVLPGNIPIEMEGIIAVDESV